MVSKINGNKLVRDAGLLAQKVMGGLNPFVATDYALAA